MLCVASIRRAVAACWLVCLVCVRDVVVAQANVTIVSEGDVSPLFKDTDPFTNSRAASFVATFLSGLSGSPMTACHVWRSVTILTVCRETPDGPLSTSQMPIALELGDDPSTRYSAGAALLAPILLWSVSIFTAVASLVVAKAKGASWRRALIVGRYPQHLLFVFFYFYQTGISSATIVVVHDHDLTARIVCGLALLVWVVMWLVPSIYLYYTIPKKAMYVKRFRDVSDEAEIEKELYRRLVQLEKENDEHDREAEKLRMEAIREEERLKRLDEHGADVGSNAESQEMVNMSIATGGGGTLHPDGVVRYPGEPGTAEAADGAAQFSPLSFRTSILKSLQRLIPEGEEEALIRHTERYIEAAARADDANKERLRRATNLVYSKMLASQIQATAFDDSAVQQTLTGRDRWEDQKPQSPGEDLMTLAERDEEDDVLSLEQQAALSVYVPAPIADYLATQGNRAAKMRSGFMNMWGGFFRGFKESSYWFIAVEFSVSLVAGVVEGWRPVDAAGSSCYAPSSILVALYGMYFVTIVVLRPYVVPLEMGLVALTSFLQLIAACFTIIAVVDAAQWASVGANVVAVCCIYLYVLKSLLDVFIVAAPLLYAQEVPWPTSKLTSYYFDTARKTSDVTLYEKKEQLRNELMRHDKHSSARRRSSPGSKGDEGSSSTRSPRRSRAGSFSSAHSGGREPSAQAQNGSTQPTSKHRTTPTKSPHDPSPSGASPEDPHTSSVKVPELNVRFVDSVEDEARRYRMIGGRRNAYVTSRGVPEALHPFAMCPLPPILHLPPRDPNHLTRKQRKAKLASERSKALLTEVKLAEMFRNEFNDDNKHGGAASSKGETGNSNNPTQATSGGGSCTGGPRSAASTFQQNAGLSFLYEEQEREEERQRLKRLRHVQRDLDREKLDRLGSSGERRAGSATNPSLRSDEVSSTNDSGSVSRRSGGGAAAAAEVLDDDLLNLEDDPDVIMDALLFSRGTFNVLEKKQSAAAGGSQPPLPMSTPPASSALPRHISNEPPAGMSDDVKRELVGQRLLSMLRASTAMSSASSPSSVSDVTALSIPRRGSPPRQADPHAFRGSGVYAGTYSPNQREGGLRTNTNGDDGALTTTASGRQRRVRFTDFNDVEL